MRYYFFTCLCMLFCHQASAQKTFTYTDTNFTYQLAITGDSNSQFCNVDSITILRRSDGHKMQVIIPNENNIRCNFDPTDKQCFAIEDMDFDGANDFRLLMGMSGTGHNLNYYYWMYDKGTKQFREDERYSGFTEPDFSNHKITCYFTMGSEGSGSYEYELFKGKPRLMSEHYSRANNYSGNYLISDFNYIYIKGKRTQSWSEEETFDDEKKLIITTTRKLVNGKLKVISRHKVKAPKSTEE